MGKIATKKATRHLAHHQPAGPADAPTKSHECVVKDVILRTKPEDSRAISEGAVLLKCPEKGEVWCRFKVRQDIKKGVPTPLTEGGCAVWHPEALPTYMIGPVSEWLGSGR